MLGLRAQQLRNLPVFGERADIQPAARTADGPEQLLMPDRQRHGAEAAHAEARDRASAAVARNGITFLDGRKQFPRHESLVKALRPHLAVEVPARRAVGTDEGDSFAVGDGGQRRFDPEPTSSDCRRSRGAGRPSGRDSQAKRRRAESRSRECRGPWKRCALQAYRPQRRRQTAPSATPAERLK